MAKKNLHPKWFLGKVILNGEVLFEVGSTKKTLNINIWSGNHPYFNESQKIAQAEKRLGNLNKKHIT